MNKGKERRKRKTINRKRVERRSLLE